MTMSSFSSSGSSLSSVSSTTPAGTISHTARGFSSFFTKSSSELAPVAPCLTEASTAFADMSYTTQLCPAFSRRTTMLAPILPSPIIPSCIIPSRLNQMRAAHSARLRRTILHHARPSERRLPTLPQLYELLSRERSKRSRSEVQRPCAPHFEPCPLNLAYAVSAN